MRKIITFISIIAIIFINNKSYLFSQNLITNPSFENGNSQNIFGPLPNFMAQADEIDNWEVDQSGGCANKVHSPEWFSNNTSLFNMGLPFTTISPPDGTHFIGMFGGELIEQKLTQTTSSSGGFEIKMFIRLVDGSHFARGFPNDVFFDIDCTSFTSLPIPSTWATNSTHKLIVSAGKSKIKYENNENSCDRTKKSGSDPVELGSIDISANQFSVNTWHEISFVVPAASSDYDWIAFEHDRCNGYMLMDKVDVRFLSCEDCKGCSATDGCIEQTVNEHHHFDEINGQDSPFAIFNVYNVSRLKLEIFTITSPILRTIEINNPPDIVTWDGKNDNGVELPDGSYWYRLQLWNDCTYKKVVKGLFKTTLCNGECDVVTHNEPIADKIDITDACCHECLIFENRVFTIEDNLSEVIAINKIQFIGTNIFLPGVDITFRAKNIDIDDHDDFRIMSGAKVSCIAEECEPQFQEDIFINSLSHQINDDLLLSYPIPSQKRIKESAFDKAIITKNVLEYKGQEISFEVYPNPSTSGLFYISLDDIPSNKIKGFVSNNKGEILYKKNINKVKSFEIDLASQPLGVYFLLLQIENEVFVKQLIKQ